MSTIFGSSGGTTNCRIQALAIACPRKREELKDEIEAKASKLPQHPKLCKPSQRVKGTREVVVRGNYVMFYRVTRTRVEIVNVVHARRQWPPVRDAHRK